MNDDLFPCFECGEEFDYLETDGTCPHCGHEQSDTLLRAQAEDSDNDLRGIHDDIDDDDDEADDYDEEE